MCELISSHIYHYISSQLFDYLFRHRIEMENEYSHYVSVVALSVILLFARLCLLPLAHHVEVGVEFEQVES